MRFYAVTIALVVLITGCKQGQQDITARQRTIFEKAAQNGTLAAEGYLRSNNYMNAWLSFADPESKLIPRNLDRDQDIWNANDCAADNYPFLVLTSYFTDTSKYFGVMRDMLDSEISRTSRVGSLPDTYSFSKKDFYYDTVSMPRVVFGTTEYIKDGLLPITEWLGETPWSDRMFTMLDDLDARIDVAGGFGENGFGNAPDDEVNGELLQALSRVYWMTGDRRYLQWAGTIAEHFLNDAYPLDSDYLRLRDHGCEIVSGLCEWYVTVSFADPEIKARYRERLESLLDFILENGRNEDGLFYNAIDPRDRKVVQADLADTWGYTLNGFYSVWLVDSTDRYRDAVKTVFSNLSKYHDYNWETFSADGYADAIEGALNLYNRMPDERAASWIDTEIQVMWSMQDSAHRENALRWKDSGIIEGWHGDGNFARTSIMYNLWKAQGTHLQPWRPDVQLGAVNQGDTLYLSIRSQNTWEGTLYFDEARHRTSMKLPVDWPRINQFPEWFTAESGDHYALTDVDTGEVRHLSGDQLADGVSMSVTATHPLRWIVVRQQ